MLSLFVPGRLCLFGEHSDWAGSLRTEDSTLARGACLLTGTDQGIEATARAAADFELTTRLPDGSVRGPLRVPMTDAALRAATALGDFFSYAAGAALAVWQRCRPPGVAISVEAMDLPVQRGLSSSAAICVLTVRAFNRVHALGLAVGDEMDLAYRGERAAGSECGRMDQACAYGRRLVHMGFDGDRMDVQALSAKRPLYLLIADLRRKKDTRRILRDLRERFRRGEGPSGAALRAALGLENLAVIAAARAALEAGEAREVGRLMVEAQEMFDRDVAPACPSELAAPRLHAVLAHPAARDLTWGGKGVGSQGEGAAQFVCRGPEERAQLARCLEEDAAVRCLPLTVPVGGGSAPDRPATSTARSGAAQ